jgi:hypothetical protein
MNPCEELRDFWIKKFHERGEELIPFFVNSTLSRKLWMEKYKTLIPIEQMPEDEKMEMKKYVRALFPDKTPAEKLEACKVIYTVGTLL